MIGCPFALAKMRYHSGMVVYRYRCKVHATLKRNYQLMSALKWLRLLMNHIPDKYEHVFRYYGYYSNRSRGARRLAQQDADRRESIRIDDKPIDTRRRANWARLIQKVFAPGYPWPPRHWHFSVWRTRSVPSSAVTAAQPCALSPSALAPASLYLLHPCSRHRRRRCH
jgi:hypothetical protein